MKVQTLDIGGYAWAKYGFTPETRRAWRYLKSDIQDRFDEKKGTITFNDTVYDVSLEKDIIRRILKADFWQMPECFPQLTELNRVIGEYNGKPLTVGKALLIGTDWKGVLTDMDRFNSYTALAAEPLLARG